MPQMAPLMWVSLYLVFTTLLIMSVVKLTFSLNNNYTASTTQPPQNMNIKPLLTWMW